MESTPQSDHLPPSPDLPNSEATTGRKILDQIKQVPWAVACVSLKIRDSWFADQSPRPEVVTTNPFQAATLGPEYQALGGFQSFAITHNQDSSMSNTGYSVDEVYPVEQNLHETLINLADAGRPQAVLILGRPCSAEKKAALGIDSQNQVRPLQLLLTHFENRGAVTCKFTSFIPDKLAEDIFSQARNNPRIAEELWNALMEDVGSKVTGKPITISEIQKNGYSRPHNSQLGLVDLDQKHQFFTSPHDRSALSQAQELVLY